MFQTPGTKNHSPAVVMTSSCLVCQRLHLGVRLGVHARLQEQGGITVDHLGDSMILFCHPSLDARPKSGSSQIISKGSH